MNNKNKTTKSREYNYIEQYDDSEINKILECNLFRLTKLKANI